MKFAPTKVFKVVNNSISRVIWVILFSEVWNGVEHRANTKIHEVQRKK